ncbi:hypothetical protein MASR2M18_18320 [Ignavibacteria bacterium]|nr:BamA/TamA family outer membrane protein [Bacteroidota bacterium]MCZ2132346.1 BamA/TamA family outer membrane protein [Bacteroidota bacterium]
MNFSRYTIKSASFFGKFSRLSFLAVVFITTTAIAYAQKSGTDYSDIAEIPIDEVRFEGNRRFSDAELADAVTSRPSERNVAREIFLYLYRNFHRNRFVPHRIADRFLTVAKSMPDGLRYFSESAARDDADLIEEIYNQSGYHETSVTYNFERDPASKKYALSFFVNEGKSYYVRSLTYLGLDNLPDDIKVLVRREMRFKTGSIFDEIRIRREADNIEDILKNNGWYFSSYQREKPTVYTDTTAKSDSVIVNFTLGKRIVIGKIGVERQVSGQSAITDDLVRAISELREGEWYSRRKAVTTVNALYQLGVYDYVSIDTVGRQILPDSTSEVYNINIFTRYKEQGEFNVSPFLNRTANDNLTNFGGEISLTHRNVFGAAQNGNIFARYMWNDFQFSLPSGFSSVSTEIQTGLSFIQPVLETFGSLRISGSAQTLYSRKFVIPQVAVNAFSAKISLPVVFPPWTYITSALPEISAEAQSVENGEMIPSADVAGEAQLGVIEPLRTLNRFTGNIFRLTGVSLGFSVSGDSRNDLFAPTEGHLFSFTPESAFGPLALYQKFQVAYLYFEPLAARTVFAAKLRLGHILADSGAYVPVERLFYAGGANSVRSYGARMLFDPFAGKHLPDSLKYSENIGILTGSRSLIEGSFEYRFTFARPSGTSSFIASQIERMGIAFFLDYGSTYNSSALSPNLSEILSNIAVGFGCGFRYSTPVGPFRVDFATKLYDPMSTDRPFIMQRAPFEDLQLLIGLGHSF